MRCMWKKKKCLVVLVMVLVCSSTIVSADEVSPFVLIASSSGGDVLHNGSFTDLQAGGHFYIGGGVLFKPDNSDFMYQASLGYKVGGANFIILNIDVSGKERRHIMEVYPLDVVAFYKADKFRLGLGLAYFLSPEYERCSKDSGCSSIDFDDALGLLGEIRYPFNGGAFVGLRYTWVDYESSTQSVDANNARINFGVAF